LGTRFSAESRRLHLARKNVFGLAAFRAGYEHGAPWLDGLLTTIAANVTTLQRDLPEPIRLIEPEATYLAWLDLRGLGMGVPELTEWLPGKARLALSPGHWFGREGAGFARMSIGVEPQILAEAIDRLTTAVG
jgi:cystathionine beta-lyase